jgi:hypothetical protein
MMSLLKSKLIIVKKISLKVCKKAVKFGNHPHIMSQSN